MVWWYGDLWWWSAGEPGQGRSAEL